MAVLSDRYEAGRLLGVGGMGEVYEAHDRKLGRRVAVKLLLPHVDDPAARARFVQEVRIAAAFTHPNVVTVFDVGFEGERPYYVMELVEGRTLAAALRDGPLAIDDATRVADAVLAGLAAAHQRGLVHRDVKPGNILLGTDGSVKLTDFGIAKAAHDATTVMTAPGQTLGTPSYLAPEQVDGQGVGPATDVYACGVVLYEMLAGTPPFRGDSPIATALQHRHAPVPPLADRRPGVRPDLFRVVERALAKDPAARYASADEMRAALTAAARRPTAGDEPTIAQQRTQVLPAAVPPPDGRGEQAGKRRRRFAPAALVGLAIGALLIAGAFAIGLGDDRDGGRDVADALAPSTTSTSTTTTSTTTTTVPTPRNLAELAAVLAGNPNAYGPRGPELLEGLLLILDGEDSDGDLARELFDDIPSWTASGALEPEVGGLAQRFLVPYLAGTDDGDEDRADEDDEEGVEPRDLLPEGPGKAPKPPRPKPPKR